MSQMPARHPIVARLTALRTRVKMVLAVHGSALLLATFMGTLIALVILDYVFNLGSTTRLLIGLGAIGALLALLFRQMVRPLSTRLSDQFLARRVELVNRDLADELISAVHFIQRGTPQANALAAKAVEAAEARAKGVKFEDALDFRPAMKVSLVAMLLIAVVVITGIVNPSFASTAVNRWFSPMGESRWPQVMRVEFLWDHQGGSKPTVLAQGEAFDVRVRVTGASAMDRRVFLYQSYDGNRETEKLMQCQTGESEQRKAVYAIQVSPQEGKLMTLRVVCVDDSAEITAKLARRPVVNGLSLTVTPPSYVQNRTETVVDLLQSLAVVVERSQLKFSVHASNPLGRDGLGKPNISFVDLNKEAPISVVYQTEFVPGDNTSAEVTMPAKTSLVARLQVTDQNGFVNLSGGSMTVDVIKDAMPTVSIEEPRLALCLVPNAIPHIKPVASDDLGFATIDGGRWRIENSDQKPDDAPRSETDMPWTNFTTDQAGNVVASTEFNWELEKLNLKPGDRLMAFAMARDNYKSEAGEPHPYAKSPALSVTILSPEELRNEEIEKLLDIKTNIDLLTRKADDTHAKTDALKQTIEKAGKATASQSAQFADLTAQQAMEAASAKNLANRFEQIKKDMQINRMNDDPIAKTADGGQQTMADVNQNDMNKAAGDLNKAAEAAGKNQDSKQSDEQKKQNANDAAQAAGTASQGQNDAIEKMTALSKKLDEFNGVNIMRQKVEDLIKKQHEIGKAIDALPAKDDTRGKDRKDLTDDQKKPLDDLKKDQNQTQQKTADLIDQMKNLSQKLAEQNKDNKDTSQQDSLAAAAKAGEDSKVTQSQGNAASEAADNKTSTASSSSGQAEAGLNKMKNELDKISQRQLEALSQQLGDLIKILTKHREDETAIKAATEKDGEKTSEVALTKIGDNQGRLHLATTGTLERAKSVREAKLAVPFIKEATDQMQSAAVALTTNKQKESVKPEDEAILALTNAIKELEKAKAPIDRDLKDKDLAFFIEEYTKLKTEEELIKTGSDAIKKNAAGQVGHVDIQTLADLDLRQKKNGDDLVALDQIDKLAEYTAIRFMNQQIIDFMSESEKRLSKAAIGRDLAWNQQRSIDGIADIIAALQEEKKKDDFEKDSPPGGGGGGGKPPLIADSQQLKLLRAMQKTVNKDTASMSNELTAASDNAEKNAIAENVEKLGKTQQKIEDVAKKIFDKFKQNSGGGRGGSDVQ